MESSEEKNPRNTDGEVPLHMAAMEGHLPIVKYLIETVADKNPSNEVGNTPLHWAALTLIGAEFFNITVH